MLPHVEHDTDRLTAGLAVCHSTWCGGIVRALTCIDLHAIVHVVVCVSLRENGSGRMLYPWTWAVHRSSLVFVLFDDIGHYCNELSISVSFVIFLTVAGSVTCLAWPIHMAARSSEAGKACSEGP
jgi:hypothetical protein